jgi:hypothetical protein
MEPKQTGFSEEKRPDNDNRTPPPSKRAATTPTAKAKPPSLQQRWSDVQFSKAAVLWICLGMIAGTVLVGFVWGGWQTSNAAQNTATNTANDAVVGTEIRQQLCAKGHCCGAGVGNNAW